MCEESPLVTIVTTTYKRFDKLFATMDSVFVQNYPNIEYIISDDGSDIFPQEEIENYYRKRTNNVNCRVIHHNSNLGTVRNLNEAYRSAHGEYILNLSCGDIFFSADIVSRIVKRFLQTSCVVLVTSRILYKNDFEPICLLPHFEEREIITSFETGIDQYKAFITNRFYDMASGSAMYFSKRIIRMMNYFDERYYLWEDGPFLAKYLQIGKLECAYDMISIWYEDGGMSSRHIAKELKQNNVKYRLRQDIVLFNKGERRENLSILTYSQRRKVKYLMHRIKTLDSLSRFFVLIAFFPEYFSNYLYVKKRRARIPRDLIEIDRILKERKEELTQ